MEINHSEKEDYITLTSIDNNTHELYNGTYYEVIDKDEIIAYISGNKMYLHTGYVALYKGINGVSEWATLSLFFNPKKDNTVDLRKNISDHHKLKCFFSRNDFKVNFSRKV